MDERRRRALTAVGGPTETRGDADVAATLAQALQRAADEDPDQLTHGFHAWPARMHPAIARALLRTLARDGDVVLDPFCGGGTVLVEARLRGVAAVGVDLNPLALYVADVKSKAPPADERARFLDALHAVVEGSRARVKARAPSKAPLTPAEARWYQGHVLRELGGLYEEIVAVPDEGMRRALLVLLSSVVVKFSRQRAETTETRVEKKIGRYVPTEFFGKKGEELVSRWEALAEALPPRAPYPRIVEGDALALRDVLGERFRADLVVTSPPYGGTYDYVAHHARRYPWLGLDPRAFARAEMGARRKLGRGEGALRAWQDEVRRMLASAAEVLSPRGRAVLLVGDAEVGGARVDAARQLEAEAPSSGFRFVAAASQPRPDWKGGAPRREHLVALARAEPDEGALRSRTSPPRAARPRTARGRPGARRS